MTREALRLKVCLRMRIVRVTCDASDSCPLSSLTHVDSLLMFGSKLVERFFFIVFNDPEII